MLATKFSRDLVDILFFPIKASHLSPKFQVEDGIRITENMVNARSAYNGGSIIALTHCY